MQLVPELRLRPIHHRSPARYLLWLIGCQKASTAWGILTSSVWNASQAFIPVAIGRAIDLGITREDRSELITWSCVVLLLGLARAAAGVAFYRQTVITRTMSGGLTILAVTRHILRLGSSLTRQQDIGNLTATITSDVTTIGSGLLYAGRVLGSIVAVIVVTIIMLTISLPLGLLVLVIFPVLLALSGFLLRPLENHQDKYRVQQGLLAARAVDIALGLRVLRGVGGERQFAAAFHADSSQLQITDTKVAQSEANLDAARVLMPGLIAVVATYAAARFALNQQVTIGQLVSFYGFAVFLTLPLNDILEGLGQLTRALVSAGRITELLNIETPDRSRLAEAISRPEGARLVDQYTRLVDQYTGLDIPPSTLMAIACADSAFPDVLAERLAGQSDSGSITLDGEPLASLPLPVVRSRILLARNNDRFFGGTVKHEIAPSTATDPGAITDALRLACAADIINQLPDGLETTMHGRGRTFSGGELQRLRLVRAILLGAEVTILVEPTNAVDAYTEHTIAANLAKYHAALPDSRSIVVFTVSPLILRQCPIVAYIANDRVIAVGSHDELLTTHPGYHDLVSRVDALEVGQ